MLAARQELEEEEEELASFGENAFADAVLVVGMIVLKERVAIFFSALIKQIEQDTPEIGANTNFQRYIPLE